MDWGVFYIIGKRKCLKWARMIHSDIKNTSFGQKKGRVSNCRFDSWSLKVGNRPDFLACRWCATYYWKVVDDFYNFVLNLISIKGLHTKLWGPKVAKVPTLGISRLPEQNVIWMWASWRGTKYIIRGKVVAPFKSGLWWVLWIQVCPWLILTPKVLKLCTNQLVVWFMQVCVNNWGLSLFLVPILELQHAPLPPKCCKPKSVPQLLALQMFSP
jgi:hypothetical protein